MKLHELDISLRKQYDIGNIEIDIIKPDYRDSHFNDGYGVQAKVISREVIDRLVTKHSPARKLLHELLDKYGVFRCSTEGFPSYFRRKIFKKICSVLFDWSSNPSELCWKTSRRGRSARSAENWHQDFSDNDKIKSRFDLILSSIHDLSSREAHTLWAPHDVIAACTSHDSQHICDIPDEIVIENDWVEYPIVFASNSNSFHRRRCCPGVSSTASTLLRGHLDKTSI